VTAAPTAGTGHKHQFPLQPPEGPGPCRGCGKTYAQDVADRLLAEALEAVEAAYGVPPRIGEYWAVAFGSGDANDGIGQILEYDDEEDARDHLRFIGGASVVRRTVIALRWEAVPAGTQQQGEAGQ
jgi:hypothetical protein